MKRKMRREREKGRWVGEEAVESGEWRCWGSPCAPWPFSLSWPWCFGVSVRRSDCNLRHNTKCSTLFLSLVQWQKKIRKRKENTEWPGMNLFGCQRIPFEGLPRVISNLPISSSTAWDSQGICWGGPCQLHPTRCHGYRPQHNMAPPHVARYLVAGQIHAGTKGLCGQQKPKEESGSGNVPGSSQAHAKVDQPRSLRIMRHEE